MAGGRGLAPGGAAELTLFEVGQDLAAVREAVPQPPPLLWRVSRQGPGAETVRVSVLATGFEQRLLLRPPRVGRAAPPQVHPPADSGMKGPMDSGARIAAQTRTIGLAKKFPSLRTAPGGFPWDPDALDEWAASGGLSSGARWAAVFILNLWNPAEAWRAERFDVFEALATWDTDHRRVFLASAQDRWWAW